MEYSLKRLKRVVPLLLSVLMLIGAAPQPEVATPEAPEVKAEEPRDQKEKIRTEKGVLPMTATEKADFDAAMARPESALLKSYIIGDYSSGTIYEEYNADAVVGLASTSKLMSMYCIFDALQKGEIEMKEPVTIDRESASVHGSTYEMKEGDVFTVEELIHAGMVVSGNDAMIALARHISGTQEAFVERMNRTARDLGLKNAHFINCHGLTDYTKDDYNRATAREMFALSRRLLKDFPMLLNATARPKIEEPNRQFLGYNTNPLMGILDPVDGLKTGYTGAAGRCFIATGMIGADERHLPTRFIGVYMGAENDMDRYAAALRLSKRALAHRRVFLAKEGEEVGTLELKDASPDKSPVYAEKDLVYLQAPGEEIKRYVDFYAIEAPHSRKEPVGRVRFVSGDREIARGEVYLHEDLKRPNFLLAYRDVMADVFRAMEGLAS